MSPEAELVQSHTAESRGSGEPADEQADTAVRQRTRRAILEAAVVVWATDFAAPLSEIADRAGVSRSTLHRYFPERQALIDAALVDALARLERSCEDATVHCTTAAEEIEGLLRASIRMGDAVIFLYSDPARFGSHPSRPDTNAGDPEFPELLRRAEAEGALAPVDPRWAETVFYALSYSASEAITSGMLPPHAAADLAVRTFFHGLAPG